MGDDVMIFPVAPGRHRPAAGVLAAAFNDEPVARAIYRDLPDAKRLHNLEADFLVELGVCCRLGMPFQALSDGKVVAAAALYPPGKYPLPRLAQFRITVGSILWHHPYDLRTATRWLDAVGAVHPAEAHFYLEYLGVLPEWQGHGFGSALLRRITAMADLAGQGCYLETATPKNLPLYERFGFKIILEQSIIGLTTWFMWRPPIREGNGLGASGGSMYN